MPSPDLPVPTLAHLRGEQLYGDDFTSEQVEQWFRDEAEAYFEMSGDSQEPGRYGYRELNHQALLRYIPASRRFNHALGFGSGYGTELAPLAGQIERVTIVESAAGYGRDPALVMPTTAVCAKPSGDVALANESVDLVTCFNVLHHIPNVSHVLGEFARVLCSSGLLLLREPTTSMGGNWGTRRPGLTTHERGIPPSYLRGKLMAHGFVIEHDTFAIFPLVLKLWQLGPAPYNSRILTSLDRLLCRLLVPHWRYHAVSRWQKIRPTEIAILAKRA
ncbi:MAG TPA: class I SAM-dependent methyltransferase [Solirubrobacteraceae bacterium]|nr:class I SAM-dependent methyltransferase [Solirubrobacteraceae bacterium]